MILNIHALQLDSVWEDKAANFGKVRAQLGASRPAAGSLIVLPEMFGTGFSCAVDLTAECEGGETEVFLKSLAAEHQSCVLGGVVTRGNDGKARNQALAVSPDGHVLARYTKMRPFSLGGEADVHVRGGTPVLFEYGGFKISPLVCYDLRFPELARDAVKMGAEVLVYMAAWPVKRFQHWITLLQARAIENQAYVVGVNRTGADPQFSYNGRSLVVDPHGVIIADAGEREHAITTQIEHEVISGWRAQFPGLRDAGLI
ncbi:nitrilase-related carbon-nitrogen hydrolase [Brevifollis gellanilyticus]|uniref:Amidohydrolase n=1 Tax=Brevifollis gellanilyticus TaxID=748831 RepID=A0A512MGS5_9BACT|nr:nitrilase-related carbon-nitrogen hydrolase [Brevifollis gellanilyticus]GEP45906.1 amidohydrolase [Brevifollis gellanilyticus]